MTADPAIRWRGLTRSQYDTLVNAGALDGQPVELLEGVLVEMAPQGEPHAHAIVRLTRHLVRALPDPWVVRVQLPLAAGEMSEPEPDLAVTDDAPLGTGHPRTAVLVIEVARTSLRADLTHKPRVYAAAGVDQYWVVDLDREEVVVATDPTDAGYTRVTRRPWTARLAVLGVPVVLSELLTD